MHHKSNGFTIVELLVVIVVIAVLASVTFVSYSSIQTRAKQVVTDTDVSNISKSLQSYYVINGTRANSTSDLSETLGQQLTEDITWGHDPVWLSVDVSIGQYLVFQYSDGSFKIFYWDYNEGLWKIKYSDSWESYASGNSSDNRCREEILNDCGQQGVY